MNISINLVDKLASANYKKEIEEVFNNEQKLEAVQKECWLSIRRFITKEDPAVDADKFLTVLNRMTTFMDKYIQKEKMKSRYSSRFEVRRKEE